MRTFEQKYCVDNIFIFKNDNCTHSSGKGKSCSHVRYKISGVKGNNMLDEDSMRSILSIAEVKDGHRATMETRIDNEFCAYASKVITCYGRTKDYMRAVNACTSNSITRSEWKSVFEKEGTKGKKICLTNLVGEKKSSLCPHDREMVKVDLNASQALGSNAANDFKALIRVNLMRDNQVKTEDAALTEKTFRTDIGELKGATTRSKPLPMQS